MEKFFTALLFEGWISLYPQNSEISLTEGKEKQFS
jgi:hypothetical protein